MEEAIGERLLPHHCRPFDGLEQRHEVRVHGRRLPLHGLEHLSPPVHQIQEPLPEMKAQADVLCRAAQQTEEALGVLSRMARDRLEPYWVEINRLENEGDRIYRRAVADLFSGDYKAMDVLKWKEVIENLEEAVDGLENVANIIESTVLKHA